MLPVVAVWPAPSEMVTPEMGLLLASVTRPEMEWASPGVGVRVAVGGTVAVDVRVGVLVGVRVAVRGTVPVGVGVLVGVRVGVGVGVRVNVGVGVRVRVGVGVGTLTTSHHNCAPAQPTLS